MKKRIVASALVSLMLAAAAQAQSFQPDVNRPGAEYLAVEVDHARRCQSQCIDDLKCVAWNYVTAARSCRLMSERPPAVGDTCCVSGERR